MLPSTNMIDDKRKDIFIFKKVVSQEYSVPRIKSCDTSHFIYSKSVDFCSMKLLFNVFKACFSNCKIKSWYAFECQSVLFLQDF